MICPSDNNSKMTTQSTCRPWNFLHLRNCMRSLNLLWISNDLNGQWTFKHPISQLASLIKTILMVRVEKPVYCKFMPVLFPLAALCGGRGSACSQDSGYVGLWYEYGQSGAIVAAWVHYNQQHNILELEEKSSDSTGNMKRTILGKKWPCGIKRTNSREHAMNTQSTLPSSPGHLI